MSRKRWLYFWVIFVVLFALGLFWAQSPAEAHATIFPHLHPHAESSTWEDFMASMGWIILGVINWFIIIALASWIMRRNEK
jgi:uncharacterized membrane protein